MALNIKDFDDFQTIGKDRDDGMSVFIAPTSRGYIAVAGGGCVNADGSIGRDHSDLPYICSRTEAFRRALLRLKPTKSILEQALEVADGW